MKYAVISDIHGNMTAFAAVLADARARGADGYLLVGDYYNDFPFPNEVAQTVRTLENAHVIRGNKEGYLKNLGIIGDPKWQLDQFGGLLWNFRNFERGHVDYLLGLPEEAVISHEKHLPIRIFHSSRHLFPSESIRRLNSMEFTLRWKESPFTHEEYLKCAHASLHDDADLRTQLETLPDGVYIFRHTHIHWHVRIDGKCILNPGSCGAPSDFDSDAAYTMLASDGGDWAVEERRVPYDLDETVRLLKASPLYAEAKLWSDLVIRQVLTGEDFISFFLETFEAMARERNITARPYPNELWRLAAERWYAEKM